MQASGSNQHKFRCVFDWSIRVKHIDRACSNLQHSWLKAYYLKPWPERSRDSWGPCAHLWISLAKSALSQKHRQQSTRCWPRKCTAWPCEPSGWQLWASCGWCTCSVPDLIKMYLIKIKLHQDLCWLDVHIMASKCLIIRCVLVNDGDGRCTQDGMRY